MMFIIIINIIIITIIIISSSSSIVYKTIYMLPNLPAISFYCIPNSLEQSGAPKEATFAPMVSAEHFETRPNLGDFGGPPLSSLSSRVEANVALHLIK